MIPEIQTALLGRKPVSIKAMLPDYGTYTLSDGNVESDYPILKPHKGSLVEGTILFELTSQEMDILNYYEGKEYVLTEILLTVTNEQIKTLCYYPCCSNLTYGSKWEITTFRNNYLNTYLRQIIPDTVFNYNLDKHKNHS
jgi:hypothetical protein